MNHGCQPFSLKQPGFQDGFRSATRFHQDSGRHGTAICLKKMIQLSVSYKWQLLQLVGLKFMALQLGILWIQFRSISFLAGLRDWYTGSSSWAFENQRVPKHFFVGSHGDLQLMVFSLPFIFLSFFFEKFYVNKNQVSFIDELQVKVAWVSWIAGARGAASVTVGPALGETAKQLLDLGDVKNCIC